MRTAVRTAPLGLLVFVLLFAACQSKTEVTTPDGASQPPYVVTATLKDVMQGIVDTNADIVWQSVSAVSNEKGLQEIRPQTDEDWAKVKHGAYAIAEATNLLMMPGRRVARPGEKSETPGVELEPDEMQALIDKDRPGFYKRAAALREAALEVVTAVDKKDADKVFEVGEHIERACEDCHSHYWYPNEKIPPLPAVVHDGPAQGVSTTAPQGVGTTAPETKKKK
jgi:cytochrome c556